MLTKKDSYNSVHINLIDLQFRQITTVTNAQNCRSM